MPRPLRLYYPGLVSLIGLTALIWTYCKDSYDFVHQRHPRPTWMFVPPDENNKRFWRKDWSTLDDQLKGKHVIRVELDEPHVWGTKPAKINFIRREIERITFTCDSNTVLKAVMGEGANYSDVLGLLHVLKIYGVKRYTLRDDCFYIFGNEPRE